MRIYKQGKTYYLDFTYRGERVRKAVGTNKKVAELAAKETELRIAKEEHLGIFIDSSSDTLKPIIITAFSPGMRKSEILQLKRENVDLDSRTNTVVKSKNNEIRVIPFNRWLDETLVSLSSFSFNEHKFIFTRKNGKRAACIKTAFDNAILRSAITDFGFHDFRHTFASHFVMNGGNLKTVQQLHRHKDIKMTMRYSHLSKDYVQKSVDSLCRSNQRNGTNLAYGHFNEKAESSRNAVI